MILAENGWEHGVRDDVAKPVVRTKKAEQAHRRRNRRLKELRPPTINLKIRALERDWGEEI